MEIEIISCQKLSTELNVPGSAVVSGDSSEVDVLVGSIVIDVVVSEVQANAMENVMNDDDQHFACESVVVLRTYLLHHYRVLFLLSWEKRV